MLREWKFNLQFSIDRSSHVAVYLQIAHALLEEIRRGRLPAGSILPGTRELATTNGWNRKTVIRAYGELMTQGWLVSRGAKGTFVSLTPPDAVGRLAALRPFYVDSPVEARLVPRLRSGNPLPSGHPESSVLCLDGGIPDGRLFPIDTFARAYRGALALAARRSRLASSDPRGLPELREAISRMLNSERGFATTAENICLIRSSQMAIYLAARMLVTSGDVVAMEELSDLSVRETFRSAGADVVNVRLDTHGLDVDHLEEICHRREVRLVFVTPHHQVPTGVRLSADRRQRLLVLSRQFGFAVVESDPDHEFHFEQQWLLPIASTEPSEVLYIGSMSLPAPDLRLVYLAAPATVVRRVAAERLLLNCQGDQVFEHAVAELIDAGEIRRYARKSLRIYSQRREVAASVLRAQLGEWVDFRKPDGGLAFWLTFDDASRLDKLEIMAPSIGLRFRPSRGYSELEDGVRGLRFGFASLDLDELGLAVERLSFGVQ